MTTEHKLTEKFVLRPSIVDADRFRLVRGDTGIDAGTLADVHALGAALVTFAPPPTEARRPAAGWRDHGFDHVEVRKGGQHDPDNLETLCEPCHMAWTHVRPFATYEEWKRAPAIHLLEQMILDCLREGDEGDRLRAQFWNRSLGEIVATMQALQRNRIGGG